MYELALSISCHWSHSIPLEMLLGGIERDLRDEIGYDLCNKNYSR